MARILVVDDEAQIRDSYEDSLTLDEHEVATASSGEQAWDMCASGPYDLIIVDLNMPGMGGLEFIKKLKIAWPETAVILQSGEDDEPADHGAHYYRRKGSTPSISKVVDKLLERRRR